VGGNLRQRPRIIGLEEFGLTVRSLTRLGTRLVSVSIQLKGQTLLTLRPLPPRKRDATLRQALAQQLERVRRAFPEVEFISRGKRKPSWTIDASLPAHLVAALGRRPEIKDVILSAIDGRRKRVRRSGPAWFCVWGVVAIQIEGQTKGAVSLEDRLVLVRATSPDDARRRLARIWNTYAEPYMNPDGYLVRWKLISVQDVYALSDSEIDPRGTEVYSRLKRVRMRPEYRWRTGSRRSKD
jgi:hypothetical protein